jgi:hypothetical protein
MYSRSAKGGEKGDPNRNPWIAKMLLRVTLKSGLIGVMASLEGDTEIWSDRSDGLS